MRILFLNPPFKTGYSRAQRSPGVIRSGTMYYPYWLAHAAAMARDRAHPIFLSDAAADDKPFDQVAGEIREFGADMVVVATSTPSSTNDLNVVCRIKEQFPQAHTVAVGTHVTATWQECLEQFSGLDYVAIGEYDYIISELAEALETPGSGADQVLCVAYRSKDGSTNRTADRPLIENMDLPWIAPIYKEFLTIENYWFSLAEHPMVMLIGGRGCKAKCFYCVYPQVMHGHRYRLRTPAHIAGELEWIAENLPEVKNIVFEDDTFSSNKAHCRALAEEIKNRGIRMRWFANLRTEADYETMKILHDAGLREVAVGFESGDDLILRNMRKGQTVKKQIKFRKDAKRAGILVHGCFMVGFPGETLETMHKTLELAIMLKPDSAQFYPMMAYPGTGAHEWAKSNGYLATDRFEEYLREDGTHRCYLNLPGLSRSDMEAFCEMAVRKFHLRASFMLRKLCQSIIHPREGARVFKAGLHFMRSLFQDQKRPRDSLPDSAVEMPANWRQPMRVPKGRIEAMSERRRTKNEPAAQDVSADEM